MTEREQFEKWAHSLPKCLSDEGGCDGDLVGLEHEPNCPMLGKEFATLFDAWEAGRNSALEGLKELAAEWIEDANQLEPSDNVQDRAYGRAMLRAGFEAHALIEGDKKTS